MSRSTRNKVYRRPGPWLQWSAALLLGASPLIALATVPQALPHIAKADDGDFKPSDDPVARLQKRIDRGETKLEFSEAHGYLESLLKALNIPVSSQVLVFSKTSLQAKLISPQTPRAIYFNDDVYVGWPQDTDALEVSSVDPQAGAVYYMLPQREDGPHKLVRVGEHCLECHNSAMTGDVPGHIMRSVHVLHDGQTDLTAGSSLTTDQSPFEERWGGWYVTGTHGAQRHMGNLVPKEGSEGPLDPAAGANVTDLRKLFDTAPYLSPNSDIVALLVLAHQTHVHNLIAKAGMQSRAALEDERMVLKELGKPEGAHLQTTMHRIESATEPLVRAMLFSGEAPLTAPVRGTTSFAADFTARGPKDPRGRSLRDLDLQHRLMRYPCSYLIYSAAFDGLPEPARGYIYRRVWEVATGRDDSTQFNHLSKADRASILEILLATKPSFAAWVSRHTHSAR